MPLCEALSLGCGQGCSVNQNHPLSRQNLIAKRDRGNIMIFAIAKKQLAIADIPGNLVLSAINRE